jgi:predicted PurR-regulated permease PerM
VPGPRRDTVRSLAREIGATIATFIHGQGTICLALSLFYAIALGAIGLDHGIPIGIVSGLVSFIPYLDSLTGIVLSICVAVLQFWPHWVMIPVVVTVIVVGRLVADYVLAPTLIGSRIKLDPVWMMFAIAAFGALFGFVGLLIAVPAAAAIGVVVRHVLEFYLPDEAAAMPRRAGATEPSERRRVPSVQGLFRGAFVARLLLGRPGRGSVAEPRSAHAGRSRRLSSRTGHKM